MSFMKDQFQFIPAILCAGLVSDLLLWRLKPSSTRWTAFHLFTFLMPTVYYTFYFSALLLTKGIAWSIHLWMGSIILAGIVGLLLSHLMPMPLVSMEQQARLGDTRQ